LLRKSQNLGGLMVSRPRGADTFADQELRALRFLQPHLSRALQLGSQFSKLNEAATTFSNVLDFLERGVVLLDAAARVVHVNCQGSLILEEDDGLSLSSAGKLRTAKRCESQRLEHLVAEACKNVNPIGGSVSVARPSGRPQLLLTIAPISTNSAYRLGADRARVVVFIGVQDASPNRAEQLRAIFGLTRAEAAVAAEVGNGFSPQEIADKLHVSLPTVRTHLRHIFSRTQVRGQVELVRLLAALPQTRPALPS
jgi:DNA-binding CsgD family transcriptional regulator